MKKSKQILLSLATVSTVAAAFIPSITSCSKNEYGKMDVMDLAQYREITGDSDKESITYKFRQFNTQNFASTKASIVDLQVHNKSEEVESELVETQVSSDGYINVIFNTQKFIKDYLAKYYEDNTNASSVPSRYKIRLVNEKDKTEYISEEFKLTIVPAEYMVATVSYSTHLTLPEDTKVAVYREYSKNYSLDDDFRITNRSIKRADGAELYGKDGVIFDQGEIYIPWDYMTSSITISADAEEILCNIYGIGAGVTFNLPETKHPGEAISGTFTIDAGKQIDIDNCGVYVGSGWLTDGYKIDAVAKTITVDANKVTDDVYIYIAVKDITKVSVTAKSEGSVVTFSGLPTEVEEGTEINGTYTMPEEYELDEANSYVSINGKKLDHGYSLIHGIITINASVVTGNVVIYIAVKPVPTINVSAAGDAYVEFAKPSKAYVNREYKLTYKLHYGSVESMKVKNEVGQLTSDDYSYNDGVLTIKSTAVTIAGGNITITATGTPTDFKFTPDFDDRITVVSHTKVNYLVDFKCVIKLEMGYSSITNWGCAVGGDETYSKYLEYDSTTKTFTLPGQYVKGDLKIWASLA